MAKQIRHYKHSDKPYLWPNPVVLHFKKILDTGTEEEKLHLFAFRATDPTETIAVKFDFWCRTLFPRYYKSQSPNFHYWIIFNMVKTYQGKQNYMDLGFRGCAKTSLTKLFLAFVFLCDISEYRKYIKVLTKNQGNAKQIVTDVYNHMIEVQDIYGNYFLKDSDKKREETMGSFTTTDGRKLLSGTIGMTQRGHLQDAARPDFILFDDVEDRDSIDSLAITDSTIKAIDEALTGLSADGTYIVNGNYISEEGVIQWFMNKPNILVDIIPILDVNGNPTWGQRYPMEKIEELRNGGTDDFYGEYMCDPSRSDATFFDRARVDAAIAESKQPDKESAGVRYYTEYQPHHVYAIGADISEGIGKDSSTMFGWDFGDLNGVTRDAISYHNNQIAPDIFGHELMRVGSEFGNCLLAPERNNVGHGTIVAIKGYPNIFTAREESKRGVQVKETLGWHTNRKTKPMMFFEFRKDWNDGLIEIRDIHLLKEMRAYTTMDLTDTRTGLATRHFDLLTAAVIGYQMKKYVSYDYDLDYIEDDDLESEMLFPQIGL